MPIIITVAHPICLDDRERDCDRRAASAARILHQVLKAKKCDVVLHISGLYRPEIDANRSESRGTLWRKQLNEIIKAQLKLGKVFVVDMHSFPSDAEMVGSLKAYFIEMWFRTGSKVYQGWSDNDKAWAWLAVKESIGETNARILLGDRHNDIMITSNIAGASTVILEVNESRDVLSDLGLKELMTHLTDELFMKYC